MKEYLISNYKKYKRTKCFTAFSSIFFIKNRFIGIDNDVCDIVSYMRETIYGRNSRRYKKTKLIASKFESVYSAKFVALRDRKILEYYINNAKKEK